MNFRRRLGMWVPEAPHLVINRTREIEVQSQMGMAGFFAIHDQRTGRTVASFRNLITTAGMDDFAGENAHALNYSLAHFGVGSGATAPAFADTDLAVPLARSSTAGIADAYAVSLASPPYVMMQREKVFGAGVATGDWREVGTFRDAVGGLMFSRALITDAAGNPVTLTKAAGDSWALRYQFRVYPGEDVLFAAQTIGGSSYDLTVRPISMVESVSTWGGHKGIALLNFQNVSHGRHDARRLSVTSQLQAMNTDVGASETDVATTAEPAYVAGSFYVDVSHQWSAGASDMTLGQLALMQQNGYVPLYQCRIDPALTKLAAQTLILNFRNSWTRR